MTGVVIRGAGTAAYCSAHLLQKAGIPVSVQLTERARVPALMLSDAAVALIRDVFCDGQLLEGAHKIRKRVVAWGAGAAPVELQHSAIVVSEEKFIDSVRRFGAEQSPNCRASWMILSTRPLPAESEVHSFGTRKARAIKVSLRSSSDSSACWIESLDEGWLFLVPNAPDSAWLLAVGAAPETLLTQSRLIREQVLIFGDSSGEFPAYPRIASPLGGDGWLACGTAAMAFDPICGDGTAHAVREAILAVAVIQASMHGEDSTRLLAHYQIRLTAGFERHLQLCREFYQRGHTSPWWKAETASLEEGLRWCAGKKSAANTFQYRLNGFELQAVV
jgi:2-polyprenyl-6-methoxyphenol hydroxylase-like FAD-dependent oxidoreductase